MIQHLIIQSYPTGIPKGIADFQEALVARELYFSTSSLESIYKSTEEITEAIAKSIKVCRHAGISWDQHFRAVFLCDNESHSIKKDWKMSKLAYCLSILNGNPDNPFVGKMQLELLKDMIRY